MLDTKDFTFFENQNKFDIKSFLFKVASYWKWFLLSWLIAFFIAYNVNVRKEKIYGMETTIAIKEESNPFFTSNTSLVFNWGGTSDQVQNITTTIKSRSHNEKVVSKLEYYIEYLKQTKYYLKDAYKEVPFTLQLDKSGNQLLKTLISIKFLSEKEFEFRINFENEKVNTTNYSDHSFKFIPVSVGEIVKKYQIGELIDLPFFKGKFEIVEKTEPYVGQEYFVRLNGYDEVVEKYKLIKTEISKDASSIIKLSLEGTNKTRLVDYLNETVNILIKGQLDRKNQFATNTIDFIDSTLVAMDKLIKDNEKTIKDFTQNRNIYEIENGGDKISDRLFEYESAKDGINRKIAYYNSLRNYLKNSTDFSKLPAPTVAGIDDPNILSNVSKLIQLSAERDQMAYSVKSEKLFKDFDKNIEALKKVLLENINSAKSSLDYDLNLVNSKIGSFQSSISKLPGEQQQFLKISREYDLNNNLFKSFLEKQAEANIVKAANLSDIRFIDSAKDIGKGQIGPNTKVNYVLALFMGFFIPMLIILIKSFFDDTILNTDDISALTDTPVIGVIGVKTTDSNLAVFEKPKSALSESFRAIRSSLQFQYKKRKIEGPKTLMLTSSISGEGKTFCSINIATVFALSEKKTVVVGLDLRKPKIFDDFQLNNDIGVVNYLTGQNTIDEVIQKTYISNLDLISAGPIPPNPSELLIGDTIKELIDVLKERYEYIILDTPPVGLVSDAVELAPYADITLYIMRQNYTKKEMIKLLNNRTDNGELTNVSIVFNGYENKAKYGAGYGYGYGYGNYSNGYYIEEKPKSFIEKLKKRIFK
jgi:succinoglycan biosynthesis transport protein ExoP